MTYMSRGISVNAICTLLLALVFLSGSRALAQAATKLYLKDGSFQLVKSYQIEGDRVRYYSVERSQWEEVPLSLVDFAATKRVQAQDQAQQKQILQEAEKTAKDAYQLPATTGLLIAPGLRLPAGEGVYAYDGMRVITLMQSNGSVERDKGRTALTMALPGPILKSRSLVVLPGAEAGVRMISPNPAFYVHLSGATAADIQLLRLKARKNDRVVEGLEYRLKGVPSESRAALPVDRTQVAPGIYRLKPARPLAPGEYALGEVGQEKLNFDVWDFGVDSTEPKRHP